MSNIYLTTKSGGKYIYIDSVVIKDEVYLIVGGLVADTVTCLPINIFQMNKKCASKLLADYYKECG